MLPYQQSRRLNEAKYIKKYKRSLQLNILLAAIVITLIWDKFVLRGSLATAANNSNANANVNANTPMILSMEDSKLKIDQQTWHGGHPPKTHSGSCWCSDTNYCLCTPNSTIDLIVATGKHQEYVWLVRRQDTNQLATMGGFVELSENAETTVRRELQEEMGLTLTTSLSLLGVFSDPRRDDRRQTSSTVFVAQIAEDVTPHGGDDAKEAVRIHLDEIEDHDYFSDHLTILMDYRDMVRKSQGKEPSARRKQGIASDVARTLCHSL